MKPLPFVPDYENPNIQWPTLHWKWDGDQTKLSGFTVFMNGNPLMQVPPSVRAASIYLWELASPIDRSPDSDRIVVPTDPPLPNSNYGGIALGGVFWDHDSGSSDDLVAVFRKTIMMPIDSWVGFDRTFEEFYKGESYGVVRFRVKGYRLGEPGRSANPGIGAAIPVLGFRLDICRHSAYTWSK